MDIFLAIIGGAAGAAFINGIFSLIKTRIDRKYKREETAATTKAINCQAQATKIDNLIVAMRTLLYLELKRQAKKYIARGSITAEELKDFLDMHSVYHNEMGGNGFLDELVEQVKHLPIKG